VPTFSNVVQLYGLVRWSKFVAQSAPPPEMLPGQPFGAHVTFKNQGVTTWRTGDGYHLGSDSPKKNTNWLAAPAVALTADVPPGEFVTFNFMAHSPNSEGTYTYQWRMVQEGKTAPNGEEWFGQATPWLQVIVALPGCEAVR